jgi:hypothetical protein
MVNRLQNENFGKFTVEHIELFFFNFFLISLLLLFNHLLSLPISSPIVLKKQFCFLKYNI